MRIQSITIIKNANGLRFALFLIFSFGLQACSNSQFGKELANSFDITPSENNVMKTSRPPNPSSKVVTKGKGKDTLKVKNKEPSPGLFKTPNLAKKRSLIKKRPLIPHPYRITIKLSKADPSAPAEVVTEALRNAGVSFEVEMIERLQLEESLGSIKRKEGRDKR